MSLRVNLGRWLQNEYVNMTGQELEVRRAALTEYILAIENGQSSLIKNKYTGTRTEISSGTTRTQDGVSNSLIFNESREYSGYLYQISINNEAAPSYDCKLNYDSLTNLQSVFSGYGNIRVYTASGTYTTKTLAQLLELYGDYLLFDYAKFSETLNNISRYGSISAYLNDSVITDNDPVAIRFSYNDSTITLPFLYGGQGTTSIDTGLTGSYLRVTPAYYMYRDNGSPYIIPTPNTSIFSKHLLDFYAAELLNAEGATIDYDENDGYVLRGTKIIYCTNSSGSRPFFLISKDVLDAFILDFYNETGIYLTYTGNIQPPTPTPTGPRLTSLTFSDPNAIMFPEFDPDFGGPYSLTTKEDSITYTWESNSAVEKVLINLQEVSGDSHTFSDLGQGSNQGNITVEGEDPDDYFDYEIQINQYSEADLMPKMTALSIKDNGTKGSYDITPIFNKNQTIYQCNISPESTALDIQCLFENCNQAKINDVVYDFNSTMIWATDNLTLLRIEANNTTTDPELQTVYRINLIVKPNMPVPKGDSTTLPGGVESGSADVINFVTDYPPGFYGGSYVPNYRFARPIYTTANGGNDFEHGYTSRSGANEEALAYLNDIVSTFTRAGQLDAICEAFIHYSNFINDNSGNNDWRYVLPAINVSLLRPATLTKDHITPKNNKCFIYPFSALEINGYGTSAELVYEEFKKTFSNGKHVLEFDILCKWFAGTSIQVVPVDYQNIEDNFDFAVAGPEMPVFPYTKDQYLNEYHASRNTRSQALEAARQSTKLANMQAGFSAIMGVGQAVMGAAYSEKSSAKVGAALSAVGAVGNGILSIKQNEMQLNQQKLALSAELHDLAHRPSTITNQNASPSITMVMKDAACPFIIHKAIRPEFMRKVDKFFTRFGYRTSRTGIPNIYKRPNFDYLECKNAVIGGNIPSEDKQALKAIMEHGITFWHYGSTNFAGVGEYKDADLTYNAPTYS